MAKRTTYLGSFCQAGLQSMEDHQRRLNFNVLYQLNKTPTKRKIKEKQIKNIFRSVVQGFQTLVEVTELVILAVSEFECLRKSKPKPLFEFFGTSKNGCIEKSM